MINSRVVGPQANAVVYGVRSTHSIGVHQLQNFGVLVYVQIQGCRESKNLMLKKQVGVSSEIVDDVIKRNVGYRM
jgi:hypothetical protein